MKNRANIYVLEEGTGLNQRCRRGVSNICMYWRKGSDKTRGVEGEYLIYVCIGGKGRIEPEVSKESI